MNKVQEFSIDIYKEFKDVVIDLDGYRCASYKCELEEKKESVFDNIQVVLKITGKDELLNHIQGKINAV